METTSYVTLALIILGIGVTLVVSLIEPIPLPKKLDYCMEYQVSNINTTRTPLHMIQAFCMSRFLSLNPDIRLKVNFTEDEDNYINSLFRQMFETSGKFSGHGRFRRQTTSRIKHRREIRSAPYSHWQQYVTAVLRLKRDWSGGNGRSRYDTVAALHTAAVDLVHFGPAFLPWHKMLLLLFETALGVPIPYWDTTIDSALDDPTQSILWTSKYFGNGRGVVTTGPFRHFQTPTGLLVRTIGDDGMLLSKHGIQRILRRRWNAEIFEPSVDQMSTLEGQHNQAHFWVGGHSNEFELAAYDPLFWTFHAYVDFVWEVFRGLQRRRGINPELDIVDSYGNWEQAPNRPAFGLRGLTIRDGYSRRISSMVSYAPMPKCPECGNSPDMQCHQGRKVCVSATRSFRRVQHNRLSPLRLSSVFNRGNAQMSSRRRGKRSISVLQDKFISNLKTDNIDITNYVFLQIKVIRTEQIEKEMKYLLNTTNHITQIASQECLQHPKSIPKNTVYVQSNGLNYFGRYKDSVKLQLHGTPSLYIGIQKPNGNYSEAYISAYDRCGRICVPNCLVRNSRRHPVYKTCTGAIRATMKSPLMFLSFESSSGGRLPDTSLSDTAIPIIFHCNW